VAVSKNNKKKKNNSLAKQQAQKIKEYWLKQTRKKKNVKSITNKKLNRIKQSLNNEAK
jgi:hypothetical protein